MYDVLGAKVLLVLSSAPVEGELANWGLLSRNSTTGIIFTKFVLYPKGSMYGIYANI